MFMGEISEDNIFGTGNKLSLAANTSSQSTRYNLKFTDPRLYGLPGFRQHRPVQLGAPV